MQAKGWRSLRKGLQRKARTTTAGRRRTCSGKPDPRPHRGPGDAPKPPDCGIGVRNKDKDYALPVTWLLSSRVSPVNVLLHFYLSVLQVNYYRVYLFTQKMENNYLI
jgi:hypothetical protein